MIDFVQFTCSRFLSNFQLWKWAHLFHYAFPFKLNQFVIFFYYANAFLSSANTIHGSVTNTASFKWTLKKINKNEMYYCVKQTFPYSFIRMFLCILIHWHVQMNSRFFLDYSIFFISFSSIIFLISLFNTNTRLNG